MPAAYHQGTMSAEVTVYGSACPACTQAKDVLRHHGIAYGERAMADLPRRYGRVRSMPQITIDGELIGGVNALLRLARSGALTRLADDVPAPWIEVKRRVGRGFDVIVRDRLGREQDRRRVGSRPEAERVAAELRG
jgi:glutaredoxin